MYNLNNLQRNALITYEEVIFHVSTKKELDRRMIEASIIVAEERYIRPILGLKFYQDIIDAKNVVVDDTNLTTLNPKFDKVDLKADDIVNALELMSADYQKLWKQYLWKLTAECVIVAAYPEGFVQFGAAGTFHNNPPAGLMVTSGFVTPLLSSIKWAVDKKVRDRIEPLTDGLLNFLCTYKTNYPLWDSSGCPACGEDINDKFAGYALDIYDDEQRDDCCGNGWWKND